MEQANKKKYEAPHLTVVEFYPCPKTGKPWV